MGTFFIYLIILAISSITISSIVVFCSCLFSFQFENNDKTDTGRSRKVNMKKTVPLFPDCLSNYESAENAALPELS